MNCNVTVERAQEWLSNRGLADLSLYWPHLKPIPQKDYPSDEPQPTLPMLMAGFASDIHAADQQATWGCAALKQGTAGGNDPADCNWPFCGCDPHAGKVVVTLQECGWGPHGKINNVFPQRCDLCNTDMTSPEDRMEWHGLGNCVEICERCTGSGIEPKADDGQAAQAR